MDLNQFTRNRLSLLAVTVATATVALLVANRIFHTDRLPEGTLPYWLLGGLLSYIALRPLWPAPLPTGPVPLEPTAPAQAKPIPPPTRPSAHVPAHPPADYDFPDDIHPLAFDRQ